MADKLTPIEFEKTKDFAEILDKCHNVFKQTIATKDRPFLENVKFMFQ